MLAYIKDTVHKDDATLFKNLIDKEIKQAEEAKHQLNEALKKVKCTIASADTNSPTYAVDKSRYKISVKVAEATIAAIESNLYRFKADAMYHMADKVNKLLCNEPTPDCPVSTYNKPVALAMAKIMLTIADDCKMMAVYKDKAMGVVNSIHAITPDDLESRNSALKTVDSFVKEAKCMHAAIDEAHKHIIDKIPVMNEALTKVFILGDLELFYNKIKKTSESVDTLLGLITESADTDKSKNDTHTRPFYKKVHKKFKNSFSLYNTKLACITNQ